MMTTLNEKQRLALKLALDGHNFVLMGSAGTGKSTVVSAIVEGIRSTGRNVSLTCSTGVACLVYDSNLQATTVHRFSGIEDGRHGPTEIGPWILNSPKHADVLKRVRETDVLIIDECSMISARTLTLISEVLALKDLSYMFGTLQIILVGDFKQLPPVKDINYGDDGSYCFETEFFEKVFPHRIMLTDIVRQSDEQLIKCILEVASGTLSKDTIDYIQLLDRDLDCEIHLFSRNDYVDDFNRNMILDFPGGLVEYSAEDEGKDKRKLDRLTVPKKLWLKIAIPVILLRNLSDTLVNGLRGVVHNIDEEGPTVEFKQVGVTTLIKKCSFEVYSPKLKQNIAVRRQYPLKPAFGLTIHKAQGMTLDRVHIDCRDIFQSGQLGVAMSRVKSPEGLSMTNFHPKQCIGPPVKVLEFLATDTLSPLEDKSCCRNCKRNDSHAQTDAENPLQIHTDDLDPDQEHSYNEEDFDEDFDNVIKAIDLDTSNITLPSDFSCVAVLDNLRVASAVRESDRKTNLILESLPMDNVEMFCKKEFLVISGIMKDLNISEPRAVPTKELTELYVKIQQHLSGLDYNMNCLGMFSFTHEPFTDDNMHICFNLHLAIRKYLMKQQTSVYLYENQNISKRFVTTESKARIRYVGGYCVAKLRHSYSTKKSTHRFSVSRDSQTIFEECDLSLAILNLMKEQEENVKASTTEEATLSDVNRRQNISRSLTCITDDFFFFFTKLGEECLKLLVSENLSKYGEEIFTYCLNHLSNNNDLYMDFVNKISHEMTASNMKTYALLKILQNEDLKDKYFNKIYNEIVKKFLMVLFAQFRRDLKSSYHVEKTLAHRKQIQISKEKKKTKKLVAAQDTDISNKPKRAKRKKQIDDSTPSVSGTSAKISDTEDSDDRAMNETCASADIEPVQQASAKKKSKGKGRKKKHTEKSLLEPSASYMDESGEMVWICPGCKKPDDGIEPMICCDICDEWFHWKCVGIIVEPEEDMWFCPACDPVTSRKGSGKGHRKRKGRKSLSSA